MGHQEAAFGRNKWNGSYAKKPLPPHLLRTRQVQVVKKTYNSPNKLEFFAKQTRKIKSRKQIINRKAFIVVAPAIVLGMLVVKSLSSLVPTFFQNSDIQQSQRSPQKIIIQQSPVVNDPAPAVLALRRAIIGKESKADFQALNPHSGALGLGQIMPNNLSDWSQELLGYRLSSDEFLRHPELQIKIIDYKLGEYWEKAKADSDGDEDLAVLKVASNWYSGKPNLYKSRVAQSYKGTDGRWHHYPSVAQYSYAILQKYRQYRQ